MQDISVDFNIKENSKLKKYNTVIVGAGLIASGFDTPNSNEILTHAHAYKNNYDIDFLGFYDIDFSKAQAAAQKWGVNVYKEIPYADIISVCVPDELHVETVLKADKLNPKLIFLEKPVCRDLQDFEKLKNIKTPILVNYSRSFSVCFQNLAKRIKANEFGELQTGCAYYGKGFIHNGSHMINLFNLLLGNIKLFNCCGEISDCYENDKTKSGILTFDNGAKISLQGCDCRNFTIFEFDLIFEMARIKMLNSGNKIAIYKPKESQKFKGYKMLELYETIETDLDFTMKNAIQNAVDYLNGKNELNCTLNDGWEAIKFG